MQRPITGVLLLDKWLDVSSNHALQWVKRLYQAKKVGHTGSLDNLATGLLPICFGQATKFCQYLLNADKTYEVCLRWGATTTTGDTEGEVVETSPLPSLTDADWVALCTRFTGEITQVPSMYSALKYQGKPLYYYARRGIVVPRKSREVSIHALRCVYHDASSAILHVKASKGTYIRTLVEDMGAALGCGAHVMALRRLGVGGLDSDRMVGASTLQDAFLCGGLEALDPYLIPVHAMMMHLPAVSLTPTMRLHLVNSGRCIWRGELPEKEGMVRLDGPRGEFFGVGSMADGQLRALCLLRQPEFYESVL